MNAFFTICIMGFMFTINGLYSLKRSTPSGFWSWQVIKSSDIKNIISFNRNIALMWFAYSSLYYLTAVLYLLYPSEAKLLLIILSTAGVVILYYVYKLIYTKFKN